MIRRKMHKKHRCRAHEAGSYHPSLSSLFFKDTETEDGKCRKGVTNSLKIWIYFPPKFIPFMHVDTLFSVRKTARGEAPSLQFSSRLQTGVIQHNSENRDGF